MFDEKLQKVSKDIKLIVCDLDGTLFNSEKHISKANREAISFAVSKGIRFSVCTGRIHTMVEFYLKELKQETPVIAANGAVIWDPMKEEALFDLALNEQEAMCILEFCKFYQLDYCALTMKNNYFSNNSKRRERFDQYNRIASAHGFKKMNLQNFDERHDCIRNEKIYKILIYELIPGQKQKAEIFLQSLKDTGYTTSEAGLLDIAHKSINKGFGLRKLAEILQLQPDEICAMGDYDNDIAMLEYAGVSIAMGNACDAVKKISTFTTKTNDEDGISWAIQRYIL